MKLSTAVTTTGMIQAIAETSTAEPTVAFGLKRMMRNAASYMSPRPAAAAASRPACARRRACRARAPRLPGAGGGAGARAGRSGVRRGRGRGRLPAGGWRGRRSPDPTWRDPSGGRGGDPPRRPHGPGERVPEHVQNGEAARSRVSREPTTAQVAAVSRWEWCEGSTQAVSRPSTRLSRPNESHEPRHIDSSTISASV